MLIPCTANVRSALSRAAGGSRQGTEGMLMACELEGCLLLFCVMAKDEKHVPENVVGKEHA